MGNCQTICSSCTNDEINADSEVTNADKQDFRAKAPGFQAPPPDYGQTVGSVSSKHFSEN